MCCIIKDINTRSSLVSEAIMCQLMGDIGNFYFFEKKVELKKILIVN